MDKNNKSNFDVPTSKVHVSEVSSVVRASPNCRKAVSTNAVVANPNVGVKRIIRKITPLDPKKLKQAGLDRKIAEALSKQKSLQNSKLLNLNKTTNDQESSTPKVLSTFIINPNDTTHINIKNIDESPTHKVSSNFAINPNETKHVVNSGNAEESSGKYTVTTKKIKLPKITITAPEVLTEEEKQGLANLDSHQRLVHVKHLLNKKLLEKKNFETTGNANTAAKHLKPPAIAYESPINKLTTKITPTEETPPTLFCVLKEPATVSTPPISSNPIKLKTLPKSPQDIARKLDFQKVTETKTINAANKNQTLNTIPKASIKPGPSQTQYKILPSTNTQNSRQLSNKPSYVIIKSQETKTIQEENVKQHKRCFSNEMPKAYIKTAHNIQQNSYISKQPSQQKLDFPENSPLKVPYPTVTVPKETPLPTIGSFKRPYPVMNAAYSDLLDNNRAQANFTFSNYEIGTFAQQPLTKSNGNPNSSFANSLVVLENKVLSQDEMIDLTELRLSTSKTDTPGFINPHKPIPEVVIKEETSDEYSASSTKTPVYVTAREIPLQTKEMPKERVIIANKQNKIIINANKLKLPANQLAVLAKKIKQNSTAITTERNQQKVTQMRILNTKAVNTKMSNINTGHITMSNTETIVRQAASQIPVQDNVNYQQQQQFKQALHNDISFENNTIDCNKQSYLTPLISNKATDTTHAHSPEFTESSCFSLRHNSKSAVEIIDKPSETEECFSAIDFIASLGDINSNSVETSLEISAEELNLNAACAMNLSPIRIPFYPTTPTAYTRTSTPIMKAKPNDSQQIENTDASFKENTKSTQMLDLKTTKMLKTLEVFHNTVIKEMEIQKLDENLADTDELQINNEQLQDFGNNNAPDVAQESCATKSKNDNKNLDTLSSCTKSPSKAVKKCVEQEHAIIPNQSICQLVLEPLKEPQNIDLTKVKVENDFKQINLVISNAKPNEFFVTTTNTMLNSKILETNANENYSQPQQSRIKNPKEFSETEIETETKIKTKTTNQKIQNVIHISDNKKVDTDKLPTKTVEMPDSADRTDFDKICNNLIQILETETTTKDIISQNSSLQSNSKEVEPKTQVDIVMLTPKANDNNELMAASTCNRNISTKVDDTDEMSSSKTAAVTTKRVSKFKKGKINLVQRNKPSIQPTNKSLSDVKKNEEDNSIKQNAIDKDSKVTSADDKVSHNENLKKVFQATSTTISEIKQPTKQNVLATVSTGNTDTLTTKVADGNAAVQKLVGVQNLTETKEKFVQQILPVVQVIVAADGGDKLKSKAAITADSSEEKMTGSQQQHTTSQDEHFTKVPIGNDNKDKPAALIKTNNEDNILNKSLIDDKIDIPQANLNINTNSVDYKPKCLTKIEKSSEQILSTPNKSKLQNTLHEEKVSAKEVLKELQAGNGKPITIASTKYQAINELDKINIEIRESDTNTTIQAVQAPQPVVAKTLETQLAKNATNSCNAILKTVNEAEISVIDVVKHASVTETLNSPEIPFKNLGNKSGIKEICSEVKGPKALLKSKESSNKEEIKTKQQTENMTSNNEANSENEEETCKSLKEKPKCSERSAKDSQMEPLAPKRRRYSTSPHLLSDDKLKAQENIQKKIKESTGETDSSTTTPTTAKRLQRLHSKALDLELSTTLPLKQHTPSYSQTLEAKNVAITFDTLKDAINPAKTETEESCHESTHDANITTPTKQRKKLRKTLVDRNFSKAKSSHSDTDSDDNDHHDNANDDCTMIDCEEGNEFLGFEEISSSSSLQNNTQDKQEEDNELEIQTKCGTLKNWLTTGKAILPTFDKITKSKNNDLHTPTTSHKKLQHLKKRWNFDAKHNEETDITDDTSPFDDEDDGQDICKEITATKNVVIEAKETKKTDLHEHSFLKPGNLITTTKNAANEATGHKGNSPKDQTTKLSMDSGHKEQILLNKTVQDIKNSNTHECIEEKQAVTTSKKEIIIENVMETSGTDVESNEVKKTTAKIFKDSVTDTQATYTKGRRKQILKNVMQSSGTDSECNEDKETKTNVTANVVEEHLRVTGAHLECNEEKKVTPAKRRRQTILKNVDENASADTTCPEKTDSNSLCCQIGNEKFDKKCEELKELKSKARTKSMLSQHTAKNTENVKEDKASIVKDFVKPEEKPSSDKILDISSPKINKSNRIKSKQKPNLNATPQRETQKKLVNKNESPQKITNKTKDLSSPTELNVQNEAETPCTTATATTTETPQNSTNKRKRGRAKVKPISDTSNANIKKSPISDTSKDQTILPTSAKKRGVKRKLKIENSDSNLLNKTQELDNTMENIEPITTPTQGLIKNEALKSSGTGRKRKSNTECNFNPRLLLITKREQLDTDEILTENQPESLGSVQCGLCLARTQQSKWKLHLAEHYGVGWQVGEEKPNIENRTTIFNSITSYIKQSKELTCRMCKKVYRSALGLLMHIETCGVQATRVICEFCKRDYAKTTFIIHARSCNAQSALEDQTSIENLNESVEKKEEIFGNTGRLKRTSTIKAENKLKALGEELEKVDSTSKSEIDPKTRIKYVPPLQGDFSTKWSKEIEKAGKASCPKAVCKFTSKDIKELSEHIKNCKHIKSGYFCILCRYKVFESEKTAIEHVMKSHQNGRVRKKCDSDSDCNLKTEDEQSSDDNDLSEGVEEIESNNEVENESDEIEDYRDVHTAKKGSRKLLKIRYSRNVNQSINQTRRKEVFDGRFTDLNKEVLKKWNSFLSSNYSSKPLYTEFPPQYSTINCPDYSIYLPTQTTSMKFNFKNKKTLTSVLGKPEENIEWSELKRYESISDKMNTYFFLGASVKLCSWLPLPDDIIEQYLVVVYRQEMFKYIKFSKPKQHHNIILIFKVTQNNKTPELKIHYGFVVRDGPVHHLTFLPSGGYNESSNRLGLVAIATINSDIKIYSLPIHVKFVPTQENFSSNENITLIDLKPSFLLSLDIFHKNEIQQHTLLHTQCLQICWSEHCGHQHIFASFSNGYLGIWDVTNDAQQNLNRFLVEDVINFVPLNYFYVGEKRVKCFAVHYDTCGPRWLAASGAYRKFVIYDIKNCMQPVLMKEEGNKNILLSMDWCPLWETVLYSYCDMIPNNGRCVMAVNPANIMFQQNKVDVMASSVTQLHYTPLENMCVSALSNGDIVFLDTKELHYECSLSKKFGDRRMLYTMDIKQLNGKPFKKLNLGNEKNNTTQVHHDWQMIDEDYKENYGLIFQSLIKLKESDRKAYLSEDRCPPVNMIPFMRINTLRCNLNLNGKNLIALGYENGFIRIINYNKETISSI